MAQRLVRAKRRSRRRHTVPHPGREDLPARLGAVLRVVYLVFTEGHQASTRFADRPRRAVRRGAPAGPGPGRAAARASRR